MLLSNLVRSRLTEERRRVRASTGDGHDRAGEAAEASYRSAFSGGRHHLLDPLRGTRPSVVVRGQGDAVTKQSVSHA